MHKPLIVIIVSLFISSLVFADGIPPTKYKEDGSDLGVAFKVDCQDNLTCQINGGVLEMDATISGGGGGTMTTVKEANSQVGGSDIVTLDFGAGFDVAESPDTEVNVTLDFTELPTVIQNANVNWDDMTSIIQSGYINWDSVEVLAPITEAMIGDLGAYLTSVAAGDISDISANGASLITAADYAAMKALLDLEIGTDVLAQQTIGIADNNLVEIDHAAVADNDYAKFTANGLEGRSYSEVKTDLSLDAVENTALSTWAGTANLDIGATAFDDLTAGDTYSNYGDADDDTLNELFAALDTAIGGLGGGHDAVTLSAFADEFLSLSTQEITLQLTDPNADRLIMWDDDPGDFVWVDYSGWDTNASDDFALSNDVIQTEHINWDDLTDLTTGGAVVWGNIAEGEIADSVIVSADIKDDTIDSDDYAAGSIDNEHLADDAVNSDEIADGAVDEVHTSFIVAAGTDPDVDATKELGVDTDDFALRNYDGSNQYVVGQKIKTITATIATPLDLDEADNLALWVNDTGFTFTITNLEAYSDTDDVAFTLKEINSLTNWDDIETIKAEVIDQDGTSVYYNDGQDTITHAAIETAHAIAFDNDAEDDPDSVTLVISGWLNSDVD